MSSLLGCGLDEVFNGKAHGADRRDVVTLMREMIACFEGRYVEAHRSQDRP